MNSEAELLKKLMVSKKIMEKHNEIGRGQSRNFTSNEFLLGMHRLSGWQDTGTVSGLF